ncbi:hypothetical protein L5515_007611 [Caenorhabditis briggsae]|uniref:Uncharacterized protein n=1 Tax=Caenorhabditis briggsae TaxID=6238 RepID=A0AAE9EYZ3_CAEBR|nr:hypothetical protein L5515_007611 [Caenorhabditis briggsae]
MVFGGRIIIVYFNGFIDFHLSEYFFFSNQCETRRIPWQTECSNSFMTAACFFVAVSVAMDTVISPKYMY